MKIRRAQLKSEAKHSAVPRSLLSADQHGDELTFEAGLLTAKTASGVVVVFPAGSFWWMEPATPVAKKPAEK